MFHMNNDEMSMKIVTAISNITLYYTILLVLILKEQREGELVDSVAIFAQKMQELELAVQRGALEDIKEVIKNDSKNPGTDGQGTQTIST